jgi:hypothetical protein
MALHVAHESNEPANGGKVTDPVTAQIQDVQPLSPSLYRPEVNTSAIDPHKLKRKIDFRLLPWLALLYLLNILDRGSIGNARVCARPHFLRFLMHLSPPGPGIAVSHARESPPHR